MKKIILIAACALIVFACTTQNGKPLETPDRQIAEYALSLDSAKIYIQRYDSVMKTVFKDSTPVRAYTIRATDLQEAMGMPITNARFSHVRVYIGMGSNNKFRLFLTPVTDASIADGVVGADTILTGQYTHGLIKGLGANAASSGPYVMDFTSPCPTSCPTGTPLY
jgi:hypothetical protein